MKKLLLSSLVAVALTGCGGDGSSQNSSTENPSIGKIPALAVALDSGENTYKYAVDIQNTGNETFSFDLESSPEWITVNAETGVVSVDLTNAIAGTYTFNVVATNSNGEVIKRTIKLHVALFSADLENASPTISEIPLIEAKTNYTTTFQVEASDVNSDVLTYRMGLAPDWITVHPKTGLVTIKPEFGDERSMPFTIKVSDGNTEASAFGEVNVTYEINPDTPDFENNAPMVDAIPLIVAKTDVVAGQRIYARDMDNDTLTYSITGNPAWVTVDDSGLIMVNANETHVGEHTFSAVVTDGVIDVTRSFQVRVELSETVPNNLPPSISVIPTISVETDKVATYRVRADDPNQDAITFSLINHPEWASIDAETGVITVSPKTWDSGTYAFDVVASDGELTSERNVSVVVSEGVSEDPMIQALRTGDHTLVTEEQLLEHSIKKLNDEAARSLAIVTELYEGIDGLTWNPSQHSKIIRGFSAINKNMRILAGNNSDGSVHFGALGIAGEKLTGQRYAYLTAPTVMRTPHSPSDNFNDEISRFSKNLFQWLANKKDGEHLNVVVAHANDMHSGVVAWLNKEYQDNYTVNAVGTCSNENLLPCLEAGTVDVVVFGNDNFDPAKEEAFMQAYKYMEEKAIPFYVMSKTHHIHSNTHNMIYKDIGITSIDTNWWEYAKANELTPDQLAPSVEDDKRFQLINNLKNGTFDANALSSCTTNFLSCGSSSLLNTFKTGADLLRREIAYYDTINTDVFDTKEAELVKTAILLGDKYRSAIDYPIYRSEVDEWYKAMFADWTVLYSRKNNLPQPDLGNYVVDNKFVAKGENANFTHPETVTRSFNSSVTADHQWTTTGFYALAGKTVTITRTGDDTHSIAVKLHYGRDKTNRAHEGNYIKHLEMSQHRISIPPKGTVTFSTPYGAPIYLQHWNTGGLGGSSELTISGAAEHPTITDFSDPAQLAKFEQILNETELPHVDLRAPASEQHLRRDRFMDALGSTYPTVQDLLQGISYDFTETIYSLAALKVQGKTLEESVAPTAMEMCKQKFGVEDCTDENLHTRRGIQHANYDQYAQCGIGCAGNPWDSGDRINPRGWLDNHEMGHNFQVGLLSVGYATEENRNTWSSYSRRDGENSNNIFPYYVLWNSYYNIDGGTETISDGHMNSRDVFYAFQSDAANTVNANNERVVYLNNCSVAGVNKNRYEAIWDNSGYAHNNSPRMSFYIQAALRSDDLDMADGSKLGKGFDIYPLLYQHARIYAKYVANEEVWNANREKLGFGMFDYTTPHGTVNRIFGNDFLLVSLSFLTGYDWSTHFEVWGLRNSDLALQQAAAHGTKGKLPMGMYVLETDLPKADITKSMVFLPLGLDKADTVWPRGNVTPVDCGTK